MEKKEDIIQLYKLLDEYYDDRQKLTLLASESGLSLKDVASDNTRSEFIESIMHEADRQGLAGVLNDKIAQQLQVQNGDSYQVGGDQIDVGDIEGDGVAIGEGAQATVHKEYKINNYYSVRSWNWTDWFVIAAYFVSFITLTSWLLWPLSEMGGDINFAVVDFAEIDASGAFVDNHIESDISKRFYDELRKISYPDCPEILDGLIRSFCMFIHTNKPTLIWHHSLVSLTFSQKQKLARLNSKKPEEQCEEAGKLAKNINADVIIYGTMDKQIEDDEVFLLKFHIKNENLQEKFKQEYLFADQNHNFCYTLGEIRPLDDNINISKRIAHQSNLIFSLILGLVYDELGDFQRTTLYLENLDEYLEENLASLPGEKRRYRLDEIKYLLGQTYLLEYISQVNSESSQSIEHICAENNNSQVVNISNKQKIDCTLLDKAEQYFQSARNIDGRHKHRALAGLGRIWVQIGQTAAHYNTFGTSNAIQSLPEYTSAENIFSQIDGSPETISRIYRHAISNYDNALSIAPHDHQVFVLDIERRKASLTYLNGKSFYFDGECNMLNEQKTEYCDQAKFWIVRAIDSFTVGDPNLLDQIELGSDDRTLLETYEVLGNANAWLYVLESYQEIEYLRSAASFFQKCSKPKDSQDVFIARIVNTCQGILKSVDIELNNKSR